MERKNRGRISVESWYSEVQWAVTRYGKAWRPPTDVYETDQSIVIKVELAGMRREDLELVIEGNRVRIAGYRPDGCRAGKCKFLAMEINYGAFEKIIELPKGYDLAQARAAYQNGFLRIDVPVEPASGQS